MSLETRLETLERRLAVREFYEEYLDAIHQQDWPRYEKLFSSDARFAISAPFNVKLEGAANIAQAVAQGIGAMDFVALWTSGLHSDIDGARARVRIDMNEFGYGKETCMRTLLTCYDDLVLRDGRWAMQNRQAVVKYFDPNPMRGNSYPWRVKPG